MYFDSVTSASIDSSLFSGSSSVVDGGCLAIVVHKSASSQTPSNVVVSNVLGMVNCTAQTGNGGAILAQLASGVGVSLSVADGAPVFGMAPHAGGGGLFLDRLDYGGDFLVNGDRIDITSPAGNWTRLFAGSVAAFGSLVGTLEWL